MNEKQNRYQQKAKSKVEQTCVLEDGKAVVKTLGCIFVHNGYNTLFLKPGTYTIWNKQVGDEALGVLCLVCFQIMHFSGPE